ncbi:hypothetical protein KP509_1Z185500 [Ceratopteris richardii]|nr:hypothetical protein KP509_1Z185500 [Ceratopteris richardii]
MPSSCFKHSDRLPSITNWKSCPSASTGLRFLQMMAIKSVDCSLSAVILFVNLLPVIITLSYAQLGEEAHALLDIKQAVGLNSPYLTTWSSSSNGGPCGDNWAGVTCDSSQRIIIKLNMSGFNLEGVLPNHAFSKLTSLRSLDFFYNHLQSPFPSLDDLKNLHDLGMKTLQIGCKKSEV